MLGEGQHVEASVWRLEAEGRFGVIVEAGV